MSHIEIDIEEIVITGVPVSDVDAFGDALRARLAALAAGARPGAWRAAELAVLDAPPTGALAGGAAGDAALGARVADSVWRGLATSGGQP
ncbi:MAG TPA: hypothetical protein VFM55_14935 [Micromonosporaceae bacterium]|nr:hypothetical protein [Micromonosporaceae bacterium]